MVADLRQLRKKYPALEMPDSLIREIESPPKNPDECIFARTTKTISADLETAISPCQFGGNPDCEQCGCIASMALAAVGHRRVLGPITAGDLFFISDRIGREWRRLGKSLMRRPEVSVAVQPVQSAQILIGKRARSGIQHIAEARILAVPHDVVGAPRVVEQAGVNSAAQVGLFVRKQQRRSLAQRDHGCVECLDGEKWLPFVNSNPSVGACMCRLPEATTSNGDTASSDLSSLQPFCVRDLGIECQPQRLGQPRWRLPKPAQVQVNRRLRLGQQQFDKHFTRKRSAARLKRLLVLESAAGSGCDAHRPSLPPCTVAAPGSHVRLSAPNRSILGLPKSLKAQSAVVVR